MALNLGQIGTKYQTADGEILSGGERIRLYSAHIISGAGGGAVVSFKNGGAAGTTYIQVTCANASTGETFDFGHNGYTFPNGCYIDVDANTTSVLVSFYKEIK